MKKPISFGKYYLLDRINVGGMAEVFKAKTFGVEGFERLLAVKRILPNIAEDEEFIAMFIDEAKISVQLQHANIAQIFDLGKVDDAYFIALEYVRGKDLRAIFDRLRQRGEVMPIPQACYVVMQVCEGLDYAHNKRDSQGRELHLVHRDISPQNVLVGYEGEIKLIDFGIAKAAGKASKTQAGILKGKFGYMSPEQVRGLPIDRRSDIFSVGIVLYEQLTGERLFMGESDFSTLEKVRNVDILPPSSYNRKIPEELERISLKALAKDPEDRYQNAIDLHDDLQAFLYTKGELYSRKDLAAWMKRMFPAEIEDENAKMEQYRQLGAPGSSGPPPGTPKKTLIGTGLASAGLPGAAPPPASPPARNASADETIAWDEEELDTQIFEKEPGSDPELLETRDLFEDDDEDRTVANEPPPDVLRAATAPELATPAPELDAPQSPSPLPVDTGTPLPGRRFPSAPGLTPAPTPGAASPPGATSAPARRQSVMGLPAPKIPPTSLRRSPAAGTPPVGAPPPRNVRLSSPSLPAVTPPPGAAPPPGQPPRLPSSHVISFEMPTATDMQTRPSRVGVYSAIVLLALLLVGGGAGAYYWSLNRPGRIEITTVPNDATVLVDNIKAADQSPFVLEKPPGPYTISVVRPGYTRTDQNVEIHAGQSETLSVTLEAAPDTGFELSSDPPGGLVWLDGSPMSGPDGQARTDFRAYRIPPGKHVLEIKGDARFQPWREEVTVEPGSIKKIRAVLTPIDGGKGRTPSPSPVASAPAAEPSPPSPPAGGTGSAAQPPTGAAAAPTGVAAPTTVPVPPSAGGGSPSAAAAPVRRRRSAREPGEETGGLTPASSRSGRGGEEDSGGAAECSITVGTKPWSELWIDGKNTGRHTPYSESIGCGKHKLTFKRPDLEIEKTVTITVRAGEKFKQSFALEDGE